MIRIAFLAIAQAHQFLHFIPAALELAGRDGVTVDVFSASRAGLDFIRRYDPDGLLKLNLMKTPSWRRDGLFGLSVTPCGERVKNLEKEGVILGYHARLDPQAMGVQQCDRDGDALAVIVGWRWLK